MSLVWFRRGLAADAAAFTETERAAPATPGNGETAGGDSAPTATISGAADGAECRRGWLGPLPPLLEWLDEPGAPLRDGDGRREKQELELRVECAGGSPPLMSAPPNSRVRYPVGSPGALGL